MERKEKGVEREGKGKKIVDRWLELGYVADDEEVRVEEEDSRQC